MDGVDPKKIPCTAAILTFNNEQTLDRCLGSMADFAELIICDGGSTDGTLAIAAKYGCKVIQQDRQFKYDDNKIADFSGVRNQTIEAASYPWYVYTDSDEYMSPEIVQEIREVVRATVDTDRVVFDVPRKFVLDGEIIECAMSYPNYHTRLFHRDYVAGFRKKVHEKLILKEGVTKAKLLKPTYVPIDLDYKKDVKKQDYYLAIERKRYESLTVRQLWIGVFGTLRVIIARTIKLLRARLFCRGTQQPFQKYVLAIRYHGKLIGILLKRMIINTFKKPPVKE